MFKCRIHYCCDATYSRSSCKMSANIYLIRELSHCILLQTLNVRFHHIPCIAFWVFSALNSCATKVMNFSICFIHYEMPLFPYDLLCNIDHEPLCVVNQIALLRSTETSLSFRSMFFYDLTCWSVFRIIVILPTKTFTLIIIRPLFWKRMFLYCYSSTTNNQFFLKTSILTLAGNPVKMLATSNCRIIFTIYTTRSVYPSYSRSWGFNEYRRFICKKGIRHYVINIPGVSSATEVHNVFDNMT